MISMKKQKHLRFGYQKLILRSENLKTKSKITLFTCMAHARRKFKHALDNDTRAEQALLMFQELYSIERKAREQSLDFNQVKELRSKEASTIIK